MSASKHMSKSSAKPIDPRSPLADAVEASSVLQNRPYPAPVMDWKQYDRAYRQEERSQHLLNTDTYCAGE